MIRFHVINVTRDRRTPDLKQRYASMLAQAAQEQADVALEDHWREAVRQNVERRFRESLRRARVAEVPALLRRQAE